MPGCLRLGPDTSCYIWAHVPSHTARRRSLRACCARFARRGTLTLRRRLVTHGDTFFPFCVRAAFARLVVFHVYWFAPPLTLARFSLHVYLFARLFYWTSGSFHLRCSSSTGSCAYATARAGATHVAVYRLPRHHVCLVWIRLPSRFVTSGTLTHHIRFSLFAAFCYHFAFVPTHFDSRLRLRLELVRLHFVSFGLRVCCHLLRLLIAAAFARFVPRATHRLTSRLLRHTLSYARFLFAWLRLVLPHYVFAFDVISLAAHVCV